MGRSSAFVFFVYVSQLWPFSPTSMRPLVMRIASGGCVMASRRLFSAPFVSVWFKGQMGRLVSSSFLKRRMKNTLHWHFLLSDRPVWLQFDLAPFVLYREPSKISPLVAVRHSAEVPYPFKETANIFLQTKEKLQLFVPLTSCHQSDFLLFELAVCLGPWESIDKLFGDPEFCFFSFLGNCFL